MFLRRPEPILLTEDGLDGLCVSLNRPVVRVEGLPAAPARAVIALHRDAEARRTLTVALRSEESGVVTLFAFRGEPSADTHRAMDDGLAFAESMGFLFDEDMLLSADPAARKRGLQCWCELTGEELPPGPSLPRPPDPSAEPAALLDDSVQLDELDELDELDGLDEFDELDQFAEAVPEDGLLSKFRRDPAPAEPTALAPAGDSAGRDDRAPAQLGRIPIVRKKKSQEGSETPPLLTRLLARF